MTTNASPRMFAQITKIDAAKREVWGRLAHEVPDRADEIFDYASSVPYFKAWSEEFAKATDGKSLGNLRAMHGKTAAGKFIAVNFNDAEKAIDVGAKVVDDQEWEKCEEGVYTGFSIGGDYVGERKTEKVNGRDMKRYTAKPTEGSLVDSPCIPTAKFFDVIKADGVIEKVAFKEAPPQEVAIVGTPEQVDEFTKALAEKTLTIADATELVKAYSKTPPEPHPLIKAVQEMLAAGDPLATELDAAKGDAFDALIEKHLTAPEIEAVAKAAPGKMVKGLREAVLAKARANHTQKIHDMLGEMGAKCAKDAPTGDLAKGDLAKITTDLATALAEIDKLKKQPVPYVTLRAMAKGAPAREVPDVSKITIGDLKPEELLANADGSIDYATSLHQKREKALAAAGNS